MAMQAAERERAMAAAMATASSLGLAADDAIVLHDSNKLALRLLPCDVLARVAPAAEGTMASFEIEVARRLGRSRGHPHHARSGGRVRASVSALLRRQGLDRD
ncbi:hypothetical protein AB0J43_49195, partial [Nonomuraea fuscirosea]